MVATKPHAVPKSKGGIDAEDARRRREASTIQIRKDKKEEGLQKRRRPAAAAAAAPYGGSSSSQPPQQARTATRSAEAPEPGLAETLKSLPEDVQLLSSDDRGQQLEACIRLRKLLSIERNPPIAEIIEAGVVPRLVQFLHCFDDPMLAFEAAWAVTNVASGTSEHTCAHPAPRRQSRGAPRARFVRPLTPRRAATQARPPRQRRRAGAGAARSPRGLKLARAVDVGLGWGAPLPSPAAHCTCIRPPLGATSGHRGMCSTSDMAFRPSFRPRAGALLPALLGAARIDTSMGRRRATTSSALQKVCARPSDHTSAPALVHTVAPLNTDNVASTRALQKCEPGERAAVSSSVGGLRGALGCLRSLQGGR